MHAAPDPGLPGRISGLLLNRIDSHIDVPTLKVREITSDDTGERSAPIQERVRRARAVQQERFRRARGVYCNAHMASRHIKRHCAIQAEAAPLAARDGIQPERVAQAIQYRSLDRAPRRLRRSVLGILAKATHAATSPCLHSAGWDLGHRGGGTNDPKRPCAGAMLGVAVVLALAALLGCQAMGQPHSSILDECAHPTPSNRDWCLRMQHPNVR